MNALPDTRDDPILDVIEGFDDWTAELLRHPDTFRQPVSISGICGSRKPG